MPTTLTSCLICDSHNTKRDTLCSRRLLLESPFSVMRCCRCKFRWLDPQPTANEYNQLYEQAYFAEANEETSLPDFFRPYLRLPSHYESREVVLRKPWFKTRLQRLRDLSPDARSIIDIGAATGDFLAEARALDWEITGVEPSEHACQRAKEKHGINLQQSDLTAFDAQGHTFDVVHLNHVFEHLPHPDEALQLFKGIMHKKSLLVIEIPNQFESTVALLDWAIAGNLNGRSIYSIHHPFFYAPRHLSTILQRNELTISQLRTHFPERWKPNWRGATKRAVNVVVDKLPRRRGLYIEAIARLNPS